MTTTPTPEASETPETPPQPEGTGDTVSKAEYDKLLAKSRQNEDRAKANMAAAKELEKLRAQSETETEKAVRAARDEGLSEGLRTGSSKIAQAELRAALAGRHPDPEAFIEGVDLGRFIGDDGEVDRAQMTAWVDKVVPASSDAPVPPVLDLGQGTRGGHGPGDPAQEFASFIQGQLKR